MAESSSTGTTPNFTIGFDLVILSNVVPNWFFNSQCPHGNYAMSKLEYSNPTRNRGTVSRLRVGLGLVLFNQSFTIK